MRRSARAVATAAVLALSACAGTVDGSGPTSTRAAVTTVPGSTPATVRLTTTPTSPAPTAPPGPTAAAPVAPTTRATGAPAPSGPLLGPAPNIVTLVESPRATRNEPVPPGQEAYQRGVMIEASNPAYDHSFVLTLFASQLASAKSAPGWTFKTIAQDPQWTPASCGEAPRAFVGHRWEVYVDGPSKVDADGVTTAIDPDRLQLVSYDVTTHTMTSYLEVPHKVHWFGVLEALDDHTVGLLFDPSPPSTTPVDPAVAEIRDRLALRRLDLRTGKATDEEIRLPGGYTYRYAFFDGGGNIGVAAANSDERLTGAPGGPLKPSDPNQTPPPDFVDGARLDWGPNEADNPDIQVRDTKGNVLAAVHKWRFLANGGGIGLFGWTPDHGWFGAFKYDPATGEAPRGGPGVYDVATASWDWVFADDSGDVGYFIIGVTPR